MCLNGFLPVVSYAAYFDENLIYSEQLHINIRDKDWKTLFFDAFKSYDSELGYYTFTSNSFDNVYNIGLGGTNIFTDMLYLPDVYDYYMMITVYSECSVEDFSFAAEAITISNSNCDGDSWFPLDNINYYHHDDAAYSAYTGFSITGKIPHMDSTSFCYINISDYSLGSVPSTDLNVRIKVVAVDKGDELSDSTIAAELEEINNKLSEQNSALEEIGQLQQDTIDKIDDQYSVSDEEDFGVEDIVDQVNEKAGVLSFGTDTLVNFLDLFDAANATNTKLTFPGFSMEIQGVDYQVWPDYHYDLSELENQFGALIEVVRWGCVMVVWLAVLNYLVKAYDTIFGR